jgi:hypothetical protein
MPPGRFSNLPDQFSISKLDTEEWLSCHQTDHNIDVDAQRPASPRGTAGDAGGFPSYACTAIQMNSRRACALAPPKSSQATRIRRTMPCGFAECNL